MLNYEPQGMIKTAKNTVDGLVGLRRGQWSAPISNGGLTEFGNPGASAEDYMYEKLGHGSVNAVNRVLDQWNDYREGSAVISRRVMPWDVSYWFLGAWVVLTMIAMTIDAGDALVVAGGVLGLYVLFNIVRGAAGYRQYRMVDANTNGVPVVAKKGWKIETPVYDNGQDLSNVKAEIAHYGLESWQKGADGEHIAANLMRSTLDSRFIVFHDVKVPNSEANADHILLGQRMAFNVDSKNWNNRSIRLVDGMVEGVHGNPFKAIYFEKNSILSVGRVQGAFPTASIIVVTGNATVEGGVITVLGQNDHGDPERSFIVDMDHFAELVYGLDNNSPQSAYNRDAMANAMVFGTEPA